MNKICTSNTIEGLIKLINQFYYSDSWTVTEDLQAYNTKLEKSAGKIELKRGKYTYYL